MVTVSYTDNTGESDYSKSYPSKEAALVDVQRELEERKAAYEGMDCDWAYFADSVEFWEIGGNAYACWKFS